MARSERSSATTWVAVALVAVLALGVGALALLSMQRLQPGTEQGTAEPVPTFTLGIETTPSPEPPAPAPVTAPGANERFLEASAENWWRATAGSCADGVAPVVERSSDAGATWTNVAPTYLGIAQVAGVDAFSPVDAELIAGVGTACETQSLRTYTSGEFWASYPDLLPTARFGTIGDPAQLTTPAGPLAAPCAAAWGVRVDGDRAALVCDGAAYTATPTAPGAEWVRLAPEGALAVAVSGADVWAAIAGSAATEWTACDGVAVIQFAGADPAAGTAVACAADADTAAPAALTAAPLTLWSGDQLISLP